MLDLVLDTIGNHGTIALCGAIANYLDVFFTQFSLKKEAFVIFRKSLPNALNSKASTSLTSCLKLNKVSNACISSFRGIPESEAEN